jgi:hypothetical protein
MTPELLFWLMLAVKMAVTAVFVLAATMTAERAGPLVGGLVATLPISAGPVYVFLAFDHDTHFIAASAVASLAINAVNVVFALIYAVLAQRRPLAVSLSGAFLVWLALAWLVHALEWTILGAVAFNLVVLSGSLVLARPLRHVPAPRMVARWYDLAMRAAMVAVLVGVVVGLSFRIGAAGSGMLAVFPIVLMSIMLILHRRVGGPATAAVMANAILGLVGFALAATALHFMAEPLGSPLALILTLAISVGWGLLIYAARQRGIPV